MIRYNPLGKWEELGFNECLTQSLHLLDVAGSVATEKKDVESLVALSREWINAFQKIEKITSEMSSDDDEMEDIEVPSKKNFGFGFNHGGKEHIEKEVDDGESTDDQN